MTGAFIFRAIAGGMKMWFEGKAKLEAAERDACTFPECRYRAFEPQYREEY
jgi:hypothetical protein